MQEKERTYWGKRGSGVLVQAEDTCRFLVSQRSAMVNEPYTIGTIGGRLEGDEPEKTGVVREFEEETAIKLDSPLSELTVFESPDKNFHYTTFITTIPKQIEITRKNWENDAFLWFSLKELNALPNKHFGLEYVLEHAVKELNKVSTECKKQHSKK